MRSSAQEKLLHLLLRALKPLVHLLLESGIGHREFAEVSKRAFIDVATKKYGIRGRATNISRVAVMTGLTRKEVKKIRDQSDEGEQESFSFRAIPGAEVLHHWHEDPDYTDSSGAPRPLEFSAVNDSSFSSLVKKYAGDIPPGALRTELTRSGSVRLGDDGRLHALKRDYPISEQSRVERALGNLLPAMTENIAMNSIAGLRSQRQEDRWPEYQIQVLNVSAGELTSLREHSRSRMLEFSESLDRDLHRISPPEAAGSSADQKMVIVTTIYTEADNPPDSNGSV